MGGSRMRVFVSYSRAQFYFAEDLALALGQRGIDAWFDVHRLEPGDDWEAGIDRGLREADAVVFVASRAALASDNVAAELGRARALGKPVFAALAERVGPVEAVAAFDLRRGLEPKLGELVKALEGEPFAPVGGGVPGVVIAVLAALALLALAGVAVAYEIVWSGRVDAAALFYVAAATLFCVWLAVEFARGRRSWLVLIVLSAPGALFALALPLALAAAEPVGVAIDLVLVTVLIGPAVWLVRSPSAYRRLQTGAAPRWLRRRMLRLRGQRAGDAPSARQVGFWIYCHPLDVDVERDVETALRRHGHRRVDPDQAERQICVVSNLTPVAWLRDTLAQLHGRVILVIAAPVPASRLDDVRRYQWVDHRRRQPGTLAHLGATLGGSARAEVVPEGLGSLVYPLTVFLLIAYFASAAISALGYPFVAAAGSYDSVLVRRHPPALALVVPVVVAALLAVAVTLSLASRRVPPRTFYALVGALVVAQFMCGVLMFEQGILPVIGVLTFTGAVALATRPALTAWLPSTVVPRGVERLDTGGRRWSRPLKYGVVVSTVSMLALVLTAVAGTGDRAVRTEDRRPESTPAPAETPAGVPYTLAVPAGFEDVTAEANQIQQTSFDYFFSDGPGLVSVVRLPLVGEPADGYAELRQILRDAGYWLSDMQPADLAGEREAVTFTAEADASHGVIIAAVRGGELYRITSAQPVGSDGDPAEILQALLDSWVWTS